MGRYIVVRQQPKRVHEVSETVAADRPTRKAAEEAMRDMQRMQPDKTVTYRIEVIKESR